MKTASNAQLKPFALSDHAAVPDLLRDDERWKLAQTVVAGPHFSRSTLLSKFLLYVVSETLQGRQSAISEHKIGVAVFGRPTRYRTNEDNIVRNYARQLRRRLADHFAAEDCDASMRIEIPVGGYIPSFPAMPKQFLSGMESIREEEVVRCERTAARSVFAAVASGNTPAHAINVHYRTWLMLFAALLVLAGIWGVVHRHFLRPTAQDISHVLWASIMPESGITYIIPADAGLNVMEDMSHRSVPLADYINGTYENQLTENMDRHTGQDLRSQHYTDFVSAETISMVAHRPEFDGQRVRLLFARDLRLSDLKTANALIIGSSSSNPWASMIDSDTNFGIITRPDMGGAQIVNRHPLPGESRSYASNWNEPAHETFALVIYRPNLSKTGNTLLLEGLDVAGTQGAAEVLFRSDQIERVLRQARRPDGTLSPFELLLHTTSIRSSAEATQIIATRFN